MSKVQMATVSRVLIVPHEWFDGGQSCAVLAPKCRSSHFLRAFVNGQEVKPDERGLFSFEDLKASDELRYEADADCFDLPVLCLLHEASEGKLLPRRLSSGMYIVTARSWVDAALPADHPQRRSAGVYYSKMAAWKSQYLSGPAQPSI